MAGLTAAFGVPAAGHHSIAACRCGLRMFFGAPVWGRRVARWRYFDNVQFENLLLEFDSGSIWASPSGSRREGQRDQFSLVAPVENLPPGGVRACSSGPTPPRTRFASIFMAPGRLDSGDVVPMSSATQRRSGCRSSLRPPARRICPNINRMLRCRQVAFGQRNRMQRRSDQLVEGRARRRPGSESRPDHGLRS